ncbi:hypothetical protein TNCV_4566311 [Trichonephila clavipes]|nr:hypothetical protein TNCV_4566311 [Trichonephila clavipes]
MFRLGGQSEAKPPVLSSQASLGSLTTHWRDERLSQPCPARGLNLVLVVWKRDALTTRTRASFPLFSVPNNNK